MTPFTRVHLLPRGPFHFGGRGVGLEHTDAWLPADTLFSALCVTIAELEGATGVAAFLAGFTGPGRPPFRLTSLMPYAGSIHLLPYPLIAPPHTPAARDLRRRKLFKDIAWTSEAVFGNLARGEAVSADLLDEGAPVTVQGGKAWVTAAEAKTLARFVARDPETDALQPAVLWRTDVRPHVAVDRVTSASAVYSGGAIHFNRTADETAGLYTVIEWLGADVPLQKRVQAAFTRLGETGIGGERSSGCGQFVPQFEDMARWDVGAPHGAYFTTLAPYHPRPDEAQALAPDAHYEITLRRGFLSLPGHTNVQRATLRMIADGSVLCWPGGEPTVSLGDLVEMTPKIIARQTTHRIYRYGLAFPIRVADRALEKEGRA